MHTHYKTLSLVLLLSTATTTHSMSWIRWFFGATPQESTQKGFNVQRYTHNCLSHLLGSYEPELAHAIIISINSNIANKHAFAGLTTHEIARQTVREHFREYIQEEINRLRKNGSFPEWVVREIYIKFAEMFELDFKQFPYTYNKGCYARFTGEQLHNFAKKIQNSAVNKN